MKTESTTKQPKYIFEPLPYGRVRVTLYANETPIQTEDGTHYCYDAYTVETTDRPALAEIISGNLDGWIAACELFPRLKSISSEFARGAMLLLILLVLTSVSEFALMGRAVFQNQQARFDPMSQMGEDVRARVKQELDIELSCGNSVVKFYALGENERGELEVHWCIRNKQAFRYVAGNIDIRYYHPQDAEQEILGGGGYYSTSHIRYGNDHLELPEGTESVLVVVSWLDQEQQIEIPITWEVGA